MPLILARFQNLFTNATLPHFARVPCTVPQVVKPCQFWRTCKAFICPYRRFYRYTHNNPHRAELQAKKGKYTAIYSNFNIDFSGCLSVCNLFLFGDAQAPTMQGRLYNGVPCLEPVACTTCRRYKRNCLQYSGNCHNNGI